MNKLKPVEETVVAVADKILKVNGLNPIIVVREDSVAKWKNTYVIDFYKVHKSKRDRLAVLSIDDALMILQDKQTEIFDEARDSITDGVLKATLSKFE